MKCALPINGADTGYFVLEKITDTTKAICTVSKVPNVLRGTLDANDGYNRALTYSGDQGGMHWQFGDAENLWFIDTALAVNRNPPCTDWI